MNKDIDKECLVLCEAINKLPGIRTTESCCGHGKHPYRIWFRTKDLKSLPVLLYWLHGCHTGFYGWHVEVKTDCAMSPASFMIEGPKGKKGYTQSIVIAQFIRGYLGEIPVPKGRENAIK